MLLCQLKLYRRIANYLKAAKLPRCAQAYPKLSEFGIATNAGKGVWRLREGRFNSQVLPDYQI